MRQETRRILDNCRGFALESAIFTMVIATAVMAVLMSAAIATFRTTAMEVGNTRAMYAAEAGAEAAIAQVMRAVEDGYLSDDDLAYLSPPTLDGFTFDSFAVNRVGGSVVEAITDGTFAGLSSLTQQVEIYTEAHDPMGNSAAVIVSAKAQAIPIFQFGVFYDQDLEITNGPPLTFEGWIHTNGNLYVSSDNAWYKEQVTSAARVFWDRKDSHSVKPGVFIADASGTDVQLDFDSRSHPASDDFRARSEASFNSRLRTAAHGVDTLRVPLPNGVAPHEIVRPREAGDGNLERASKWAWKADLYVVVNLDQPSLHAGAPPGSGNDCTAITFTRPAGLASPPNGRCIDFFDFEFEQFVDGRENRSVDVLNLDLDKMYDWVAEDPTTNSISLVYVEFQGTGLASAGADGQVFPVLRVSNADQLDAPLSVATAWPLYVLGDYNTGAWRPSALVGDALTFLSKAWSDADHSGPGWPGLTAAADTEVNAAVMAGHSATACDHEDGICALGSPYGGGLENFPRFLEHWGGVTLSYRGSLVSLYNSQLALEPWSYGIYYEAPNRDWLFDTRFRDPANLPPGTPVVGNVLHTAFRPVH